MSYDLLMYKTYLNCLVVLMVLIYLDFNTLGVVSHIGTLQGSDIQVEGFAGFVFNLYSSC